MVLVGVLLLRWAPLPLAASHARGGSGGPSVGDATGVATVVIEPPEGPGWEVAAPWTEGTLLALMEAAAGVDPRARFEHRGAGPGAFVVSIAGIENQGAEGRNWVYSLNGKAGGVGVGVARARAGDRVLWRFSAKE